MSPKALLWTPPLWLFSPAALAQGAPLDLTTNGVGHAASIATHLWLNAELFQGPTGV